MTDDREFDDTPDEPSPEDFRAAAEEAPDAGPRSFVLRVLRLVVVLFVVLALVFYLAVPVTVYVSRATHRWLQDNQIRPAPLAPVPTSTPPART